MLHCFGFESVAVVVGDLYFQDPEPDRGQEGPEHGVRLEVRMLRGGDLRGSIYSAAPLSVEELVWRADLLESMAGQPNSHDRMHHHPTARGWEPGKRKFVPELTRDPLPWVGAQLCDLDTLLDQAGIDRTGVDARDAQSLRDSVPEILDVTGRLLDRVRSGELGVAPPGTPPWDGVTHTLVRNGWL